jgi:RNA polymerase sigma-70 factor (ECF subfamily)
MCPDPRLRSTPSSGDWREWLSDARATARRLTRDPARADDIAQEALIILVRLYSRVRDPHSWLLVVLRRLAARTARLSRERALDGEPEPFLEISPDSSLDMERAFAALPDRQVEILAFAFEGYSHAEIALRLGCAVNQVGPRLHRAYRALGRRLGEGYAPSSRPRS